VINVIPPRADSMMVTTCFPPLFGEASEFDTVEVAAVHTASLRSSVGIVVVVVVVGGVVVAAKWASMHDIAEEMRIMRVMVRVGLRHDTCEIPGE
jgi:hypothetical protein